MDITRGPVTHEDIVRESVAVAIDRIKRRKYTSDQVIRLAIKLIKDGVIEYGWTWESFGITEAELSRHLRLH